MWRHALAQRGAARVAHLRFIAGDMLAALSPPFDLYTGYEEPFVESVLTLADHGLFLDNDMLAAYQALGSDVDEAPGRLLALLISRLSDLAGNADLAEVRARGGELADFWCAVTESKEDELLTVAQVAARYRVTPQAVYKWIHAGKVQADETPGGSYRIPGSQFRTDAETRRRRAELRRRLAERARRDPPLSDDELVAAIRESRRD